MKKLFVVILSVLLCGTIFTSFSPSLDGRAVVAPEGTMPKGVFAKTVGYLPGDSISVTSLSSKKSVDILVIGSIDSSEGVAILLSPEAAELLGLSKDANNVVKITKRSGQLDEAVAGTAVIGGEVENSAADLEDENVGLESENIAAQNAESEAAVEEISGENADETENLSAPEDVEAEKTSESENAAAEPEVILAPENLQNEEIDEESVEADSMEEIPEEKSDDAEKIEEPENIEATESAEIPEAEENLAPVEECPENNEPDEKIEAVEGDDLSELAEKSDETEKIEATEVPPVEEIEPADSDDEIVSEVPFDEESVEADNLSDIEEEKTAPAAEESEPENVEDKVLPENVPESEIEPEVAPELAVEPEVESVVPETPESEKSEENSDDESYEPIVLVPAESNPPASEPEKSENPAEPLKNEVAANPVETKSEAKVPAKTEKTSKAENAKNPLEKYKVESLKNLESGKYYIQIAVLADESNLKATVAKFENQYPVTLVPLASGKATQVLIGPLNMDEYGAVLNRFKKSGYKDAFLRKIK